jgi:localization factor PodJL
MNFSVPRRVKGIRPEAREQEQEAVRRLGVSLGEGLNAATIQRADEEGIHASPNVDDGNSNQLETVHQHLDDITQRIGALMRTGPAAHTPKKSHTEADQLAELIGRFDKQLDQIANVTRPASPPPSPMRLATPSMQLPPPLDRAVAEIAARRRTLSGSAALVAVPSVVPPQAPRLQAQAALAMAAPAPASMPLLAQSLSGLEDLSRKIADQIATLRKPGVEEAINALRQELGEIGRALGKLMPRRDIDAIEGQIQGLNQRIAEGRWAGIDANALSAIEHRLVEVRNTLRGLTPAEMLISFNEAVAGLAHKIDLNVVEKDPANMAQLENSITALREISNHIADNETVRALAEQVQSLGQKFEYARARGAALDHLEQSISALSDAIAQRAQSSASVPPRLEALVDSLSAKLEQLQHLRANGNALSHLEDGIVRLVDKLSVSDSRLGHLEAIERGLGDLLLHIEQTNKAGRLRAANIPSVDNLRQDQDWTQDALEAMHGTLGHVVDGPAMVEKDIRGERARIPVESDALLTQPAGRVTVRAVSDTPSATSVAATPMPSPAPPSPPPPPAAAVPAPLPRGVPQITQLPIALDLPPDQLLEPGSGLPPLHANPAARIAASEVVLKGAQPAAPQAGKSNFIAAARRAAQAAAQAPSTRPPQADTAEAYQPERPPLRDSVKKRVKSLFVAASIIAVVSGSIQTAGNFLNFGNSDTQTAQAPAPQPDKIGTVAETTEPQTTPTVVVNPLALPQLPTAPLVHARSAPAAGTPLENFNATVAMPSLFNPPLLSAPNDVTGSIQASRPAAPPSQPSGDSLPIAIGGPKLRSAAVAGDAAAAYEIAKRYAEGHGVPVDLEEAARWFERAASKGLAPAQFRYASMLEKGQGVHKDLTQARRLYLAAAGKGNGKAMHNLAVLYAEGVDGPPDYSTAVQWFRKAAQRGIADSQYNLAVLCERGLGTTRSYAEAYKWFALAAAQGDNESARKRDEVTSHMDPATLAAAKETVGTFVLDAQPEEAIAVAQPPGGWDIAAEATPPRAGATARTDVARRTGS